MVRFGSGQVGSRGHEKSHGSGRDLTRPDPTRPERFDLTSGKPCFFIELLLGLVPGCPFPLPSKKQARLGCADAMEYAVYPCQGRMLGARARLPLRAPPSVLSLLVGDDHNLSSRAYLLRGSQQNQPPTPSCVLNDPLTYVLTALHAGDHSRLASEGNCEAGQQPKDKISKTVAPHVVGSHITCQYRGF